MLLNAETVWCVIWDGVRCRFEMRYDPHGRPYYVDHNTRTTTWERPIPFPPGYDYYFSCYRSRCFFTVILLMWKLSNFIVIHQFLYGFLPMIWCSMSKIIAAAILRLCHFEYCCLHGCVNRLDLFPGQMYEATKPCFRFCVYTLVESLVKSLKHQSAV